MTLVWSVQPPCGHTTQPCELYMYPSVTKAEELLALRNAMQMPSPPNWLLSKDTQLNPQPVTLNGTACVFCMCCMCVYCPLDFVFTMGEAWMYPSGCLQVVSSLEYRCGETVMRGVTAWEGGADPQGSNQENVHMYQAQQWGRSLTAVAM